MIDMREGTAATARWMPRRALALLERVLPLASLALRVPPLSTIVVAGDELFREALLDEGAA